MPSIEHTIFSNLVGKEDYGRKVIPFLRKEYFHDPSDKALFDLIETYVLKYNRFPTKETLAVDLETKHGVDSSIYDACKKTIFELECDPKTDCDWIADKTEKFCQEKSVYNAIMQSIQILDGKDQKMGKGSIPQILSDALAVSFDTHIGHNFLDDSDSRYEFYHRKENRLPFSLDFFNRITKGGLPNKTLNIILAGCVHPDTKVKIRFRKKE